MTGDLIQVAVSAGPIACGALFLTNYALIEVTKCLSTETSGVSVFHLFVRHLFLISQTQLGLFFLFLPLF